MRVIIKNKKNTKIIYHEKNEKKEINIKYKIKNNYYKIINTKIKKNINIIDSTGGLGIDTIALSSKQTNITLIEKNPLIVKIIRKPIKKIIKNIKIINENSIKIIKKENPDIIFIDPIINRRKKNTKTSKEMNFLRKFSNTKKKENNKLLDLSIKKSKIKVIVKRQIKSNYLNDKKPNYSIKKLNLRLDIYIKKLLGTDSNRRPSG